MTDLACRLLFGMASDNNTSRLKRHFLKDEKKRNECICFLSRCESQHGYENFHIPGPEEPHKYKVFMSQCSEFAKK